MTNPSLFQIQITNLRESSNFNTNFELSAGKLTDKIDDECTSVINAADTKVIHSCSSAVPGIRSLHDQHDDSEATNRNAAAPEPVH